MDSNWRELCTEHNKLSPSVVRHVHRVQDKVIRINFSPGETNVFGEANVKSQRLTRLLDQNHQRASELINAHLCNSAIRVPRMVDQEGEDLTVWDFIDGVPLDHLWPRLSLRQREGIKWELREFIAHLWRIPTPTEFAVGSLCSSHELLCDNFHPLHPEYARAFWTKNGPFQTVADYHSTAKDLFYGYHPKFPVRVPVDSPQTRKYLCSISDGLATARPVFDHLDWSQSNIIVHPNGDHVAGIIDWEYAAFIPDPQDYFQQNVSSERLKKEDWWELFEGVMGIFKSS